MMLISAFKILTLIEPHSTDFAMLQNSAYKVTLTHIFFLVRHVRSPVTSNAATLSCIVLRCLCFVF